MSRASFVPPLRFRTSSLGGAARDRDLRRRDARRRAADRLRDPGRRSPRACAARTAPAPIRSPRQVLPVAARPGVRVRRRDDEPVEREVRDARADRRLELLRHERAAPPRRGRPGSRAPPRTSARAPTGSRTPLARPAQPREAGDGRSAGRVKLGLPDTRRQGACAGRRATSTRAGSSGRSRAPGERRNPEPIAGIASAIATRRSRGLGGQLFQARIVILPRLMGYDVVYDKMKDECGVFGIWALGQSEEAANYAYLGLHALQHRGQESAGIVATDGETLHVHRDMGLVADVFTARRARSASRAAPPSATSATRPPAARTLQERAAARGAVRGRRGRGRAQRQPRQRARRSAPSSSATGSIFQASTDTEVIVHLIARARAPGAPGSAEQLVGAVREALWRVTGAYSMLFLRPRRSSARAIRWASARSCSAGSRAAGCSRARPARSTSSRRSTCARSSPARSSSSTAKGSAASGSSRRSRLAAPRALRLRAHLLRAAGLGARSASRSTRCATRSASSSREEHPVDGGRRHPGAGLGRARGDRLRRARAGSRSRWGSSARTTSAARSSSRRSRSGTSA